MAEKQAEALRKITLGTCNAQPSAETIAKLEKTGKPIALMDVFGIARRAKPGVSTLGEYVKFLGNFKAVNLADKSEYTAPVVILPKFLEEQLYAVMGGADQVSDVQFGFRVSAKYDKKAATKYSYTAASLLKPADNDPLAMLEAQIADARRALPAPAGS